MNLRLVPLILLAAGNAAAQAVPIDAILRIVETAEKAGARVGLHVREPTAGTAIVSWRDAEPFVPASNQKILTCSAALMRLSADHRFTTRFSVAGEVVAGVAAGPLVVEAGGDPCLSSREGGYAPSALFAALAGRLKQLGIRRIAGGLAAVCADWPGPSRPPTWPNDQLGNSYAAPTAGLVLQEGCVDVTIDPSAGAEAKIRLEPAGLPLAVRGRIAVTDDRKAGGKYGASLTGDTLRLSGACWRRAGPTVARLPVSEPEAIFLQAMRSALVENGVDVTGEDRVLRAHAQDLGPMTLCFEQKTPITGALRSALTDSSNFHAEMILRSLARSAGAPGSLEEGCRELRKFLSRYETNDGEVAVADGSGLSRENRASARILARSLADAIAFGDDGHVLVSSLAVGGASGTLEGRFRDSIFAGRVRAKTGWIRGASALSGVVDAKSGKRYVFSILMNYDPKKEGFNRELKEWQDRIVALLIAS